MLRLCLSCHFLCSCHIFRGKSESITITNEQGRLSKDDIDRMIHEAESFAAEDALQRKKIDALNGLSSYVYGLKSQLGDHEGLGGKVNNDDKDTLLAVIKDTGSWIDEQGRGATLDDLEEKLAGTFGPSPSAPCRRNMHFTYRY